MLAEETINNLNQTLFQDWLKPSTGRRSRQIINQSEYESKSQMYQTRPKQMKMFDQFIVDVADDQIQSEFQRTFIYGIDMEIWRKGRIKSVKVFLDQNIESFIWISSNTKAFLFDLCYTTLSRFDYELEKVSNVKDFLVLRYFGQEIPILFRGEARNQVGVYFKLFERYINWIKAKNVYPPYFSRIMKLYTMEEVKQNVSRKKTAMDVLKVSEIIGMTQKNYNSKILTYVHQKHTKEAQLSIKTELSDPQIISYFKILQCIGQLIPIYELYGNTKIKSEIDYLTPNMSKKQFQKFLIEEQGEAQIIVRQIIEKTYDKISFYDFCSYLESQYTNYAAEIYLVDQSLPLNDYFCFSSHNTYLTGNQLTSDSKIERYIEDLTLGVKCVEIDVHNDGETPIITHAVKDKSLCKPIDFEQTIKQINHFCESHPNHYPIILSIQNHAKEENRYKMLNILSKHFQKRIFFLGEEHQNEDIKDCRSLSYLRGKIIIKTDSKIDQILNFKKKTFREDTTPFSKFVLPYTFDEKKTFTDKQFEKKYYQFQKFTKNQEERKNSYQIGIPKILFLPISQMTKVTSMFKSPTGIQNAKSIGYECTSLTHEKIMKTNEQKIIDYTKRSFLRSYPVATDIGSSNYNPVHMLKIGAQIIALNTQTRDDYAWLMMSYFTAGRQTNSINIGYIDKPLHLRSSQARENIEHIYEIKILSNKEKIRIRFFGSQVDMKANSNSSNIFRTKNFEEGFLMFEVNQDLKDCIPLRFIRKGYRVLVAKNQMFLDSGIRIVIHISIK